MKTDEKVRDLQRQAALPRLEGMAEFFNRLDDPDVAAILETARTQIEKVIAADRRADSR